MRKLLSQRCPFPGAAAVQWRWYAVGREQCAVNNAALIGSLTAWAVVVLLMDMTWYFHAAAVFGTIVLCLVATLAIGFAGTWRALGQKAAPLLRNK